MYYLLGTIGSTVSCHGPIATVDEARQRRGARKLRIVTGASKLLHCTAISKGLVADAIRAKTIIVVEETPPAPKRVAKKGGRGGRHHAGHGGRVIRETKTH